MPPAGGPDSGVPVDAGLLPTSLGRARDDVVWSGWPIILRLRQPLFHVIHFTNPFELRGQLNDSVPYRGSTKGLLCEFCSMLELVMMP